MINKELPMKVHFQTGRKLSDGTQMWATRLRTTEETKNLELIGGKYNEKELDQSL